MVEKSRSNIEELARKTFQTQPGDLHSPLRIAMRANRLAKITEEIEETVNMSTSN